MEIKAIQKGENVVYKKEFSTIAEMILYTASKYPEKGITYVEGNGNEKFISYPDLIKSAKKRVKSLREMGLKPNDKLILVVDDPIEFYKTFWACVFAGVVAVPVAQPGTWKEGTTGINKLMNIWNVIGKPSIVVEENYMKKCSKFDEINFISTAEFQSEEEDEIYWSKPDDLVFIQFSSGSTGIPKGVQITNKNILANNLASIKGLDMTDKDIAFTWLPHTHDMGLFGQHLCPIVCGCSIVVFTPYTFVRSPYLFLKKICDHHGTWFCSTNFGYEWMYKNISDDKLETLDLSCLRFTLNGAEPIAARVTNSFIEKFAKCGYKENRMFPSYGMAEATLAVAMPPIGEKPRAERISRSRLINENIAADPVDENDVIEFYHEGSPVPGISIRIADEEGNVFDENAVGEIQIKGDSVTRGYYNREDLNRELFVDGWLRTGDLGFMRNGSLVITGRVKDIIIIRGQNYYSHDIEEIIYQNTKHDKLNIAVSGTFNTENQKEELIVFVKKRFSMDEFMKIRQEFINIINEKLGIQITHVIPVSAIPKTTSGKVQRYILRKNYENNEYAEIINEIENNIEKEKAEKREISMPSTEFEKFLQKVWSDILDIPKEKISIDDSFLGLGGNSIKSYQMLGKIEEYLNREAGYDVLASCKTIREIEEYINENKLDKAKKVLWESRKAEGNDIAVTGLAFKCAGADTKEEFWDNLCTEKQCITRVSEKRKELSGYKDWNSWIGEINDIEKFDNEFFGISEDEAVFMDPQHRLALEKSYEALEDAGIILDSEEEKNIGVYCGVSSNTYNLNILNYIKENGMDKVNEKTMVNNLNNVISARIAHQYNFTGPAMAVDTACSSFLSALNIAVKAIKAGEIEGAVVIGSNLMTTPSIYMLAEKGGIVSSNQYTKAFDKDADGSVLGEGVAAIYIEKLSHSIKERKNIYGIIRGTAVNNDGYSLGIMAPNPKGQYEVLLKAYKDAGVLPNEISYIEAHGTGTKIGDPVEINALAKLFKKENTGENKKIAIGSVKSNIGHLLAGAGGAGVIKTLLCLKNKKLVPTMNLKNINPSVQLEKSPFYIVDSVEDWTTEQDKTRKAGVSSFGLGGTNSHVILEEWNGQDKKIKEDRINILTISAKSQEALDKSINDIKEFIDTNDIDINDVCFTRNRYRTHYGYRAACLISNSKKSNFCNIEQGQFLKNRAAKVCILIGELKEDSCKENILKLKNNDLFNECINMINSCAAENKINELSSFNEEDLKVFEYYYLLLTSFKSCIKGKCYIDGAGKGRIMAQLINKEISLSEALAEYFAYEQINNHDESYDHIFNKSIDVIAGIGIDKNHVNKSMPDKFKKRISQIDMDIEGKSYEEDFLNGIKALYISGADIEWKYVNKGDEDNVVNLPSYPFNHKSFWINK